MPQELTLQALDVALGWRDPGYLGKRERDFLQDLMQFQG